MLLEIWGVVNTEPLPIAGLPKVSAYQFTVLLKEVNVKVAGLIYDVSLNVTGGSAKSTTTTEVIKIESWPRELETKSETSYVPSFKYVWIGFSKTDVFPSPKSHNQLLGWP